MFKILLSWSWDIKWFCWSAFVFPLHRQLWEVCFKQDFRSCWVNGFTGQISDLSHSSFSQTWKTDSLFPGGWKGTEQRKICTTKCVLLICILDNVLALESDAVTWQCQTYVDFRYSDNVKQHCGFFANKFSIAVTFVKALFLMPKLASQG